MARHGENIYKRKDGRYEGRYVVGKKENGKTKFGYLYGYRYTDVQQQLLMKKAEVFQTKQLKERQSKITVKQWFQQWMEEDMLGSIKPSSYQAYWTILQKHIFPSLGYFSLAELSRMAIHQFIIDLNNQNYASSTIRSIFRLLNAGLKSALQEGIIQKNPCHKFKIAPAGTKEQRVLTLEEQKRIRSYTEVNAIPILLSLYTGMRLGEICALKWEDVNWQEKIIAISRTVQRLKASNTKAKTALVIGTAKSIHSNRFLPIPDFIMRHLQNLYQTERGNAFIFGRHGRVADPRTIQCQFYQIAKKLDMKGIHFHSLRHPYVKLKTYVCYQPKSNVHCTNRSHLSSVSRQAHRAPFWNAIVLQ